MNDHDHDHELIMSLAEGRLDDAAARGEIEACPDCAADLAAQRVALDALAVLRDAPDAGLTELESARLLRALDRDLGHVRAETRPAAASRWRRRSWAPAFGVAAVLLALLLVAPALDLLGGGDDDSGASFDVALEATSADSDVTAGPAEVPDEALSPAAAQELVPATTAAAAAGDGSFTLDDELVRAGLLEILDLLEAADGDTIRVASTLASVDLYSFARAVPPDACESVGAAEVPGAVESTTLGDLVLDGSGSLYTVTVHTLSNGDRVAVAHDPLTCAVVAVAP